MYSLEQYAALHQGAGLVDRTGFQGRLRLTGADRRTYLQGLLTNDIVALAPGGGCYAAYLTAQGRMISDLRVFETGDSILADLPASRAALVRTRLADLVFSEDVEVADLTSATAQLAVCGPRAAGVLASALAACRSADEPSPPSELLDRMALFANGRWDFRGAPLTVARGDEFGVPAFDLVLPLGGKDDLSRLLRDAGAMAVDPATADTCRIEAGRPLFGVDMDEETIPLEAGIEDRAISLTKGCYVGQEIIIRVLHRGHGRVARRLVGLTLDGDVVPSRDDVVRSGEKEIGRVTSATLSPALTRPIALGYVHRDFADPGTSVAVTHEAAPLRATVVATPFVHL
ncbi:MAG: hypothetical protein A3H96_00745 [Acidobacteria bacterium RIFCSPLOWO2_02_FULL_67_36]|nr:MAG: hypothetical protein A3H96_00745 [Acidobacteria bacterium RIFCSPLOWO2_02_FULL_67_36]OFW23059.1 MAG: hypothetical protein A3G21_00605 [Acidobacteria bacterium RIFCSPLOWO2_12_FULL_66_21]